MGVTTTVEDIKEFFSSLKITKDQEVKAMLQLWENVYCILNNKPLPPGMAQRIKEEKIILDKLNES